MIYNPELHNFKQFISNWDIETEYVLFGASKECVQFIRSMDFLLGSGRLKIKYIVDHDVKSSTIINNLNEISSYYRESKQYKSDRKNIKLIHIDEFNGIDNVLSISIIIFIILLILVFHNLLVL